MMKSSCCRAFAAILAVAVSSTLPAVSPAAAQGAPFACSGESFISQRRPSQLFQFFQNNPEAFAFSAVGTSAGSEGECPEGNSAATCNLQHPPGTFIEVNNLAFRSTDGHLYAVNLGVPSNDGGPIVNTNSGIVRIDAGAIVEDLGVPEANGGTWPNVRLDAGDISQDGHLMFVHQGGGTTNINTFAIVDLRADPPEVIASPTIQAVAGTNASTTVNDWAYNRIDGNLYGGNRDQGRVARLNLAEFLPDPIPKVGAWPMLGDKIFREDFDVAGCDPMNPPEDGVCNTDNNQGTPLPSVPLDSGPNGARGAYGGAWFNASGTLFLYRNICQAGTGQPDPCFECGDPSGPPPAGAPPTCCNPGDPNPPFTCPNDIPDQPFPANGKLFRIDLGIDPNDGPSPPATPRIVRTRIGRDSERFNDSASCIRFPRFGPAKQMTATCGLPSTVTIEYVIENFEMSDPPDDDLIVTDLSAIDDLRTVFGTPDVDDSGDDHWNFVSISSVPAGYANTAFNGGDGATADVELIASGQSLGPQGAAPPTPPSSVTITVEIEVRSLAFANMGQLPDPPPPLGSFCNQIEVSGVNFDGVTISDLSTVGLDPDPNGDGEPDEALISCVTLATPGVTLDKTGEFDDGGDGADPGDPINYMLTVSNPAVDGAVTLENLVVSDPLLGTIECEGNSTPPQIATLEPGMTVRCSGSYPITAGDINNTVTNVASVSATPVLPDPPFPDPFPASCPPVIDSDDHDETIPPVTPPVPCIDLLKSCQADLGSDGVAQLGELIDFELVVSNCGEVTLDDVSVDDPLVTVDCAPATNGAITLDPGESATCLGTYVITEADIEAGVVCNVATATGFDPVGLPVTSLPAESCCELPAIEIPTLGHLGLALLALGLAGLGLRRLRRGS